MSMATSRDENPTLRGEVLSDREAALGPTRHAIEYDTSHSAGSPGGDVIAAWRGTGAIGRTAGIVAITIALASARWPIVPLGASVGVALLVPAAFVDHRERRLPDGLVVAALAGAVITTVVTLAVGPTGELADQRGRGPLVADVALGALAVGLPLLLAHLVSPAGMGFGDVKAGAVLGAVVGLVAWELALSALVLAAGFGAAVGTLTRARTIPFGVALVAGGAVALALAPLLHDGAR
jgi:leader peptidase (prepilin peptidase)/N-methyltransferase